MKGYNEGVNLSFSLSFNGSYANIVGLLIPVSEASIVVATVLSQTGAKWFKYHKLREDLRKQFIQEGTPKMNWGIGVRISWLINKWANVAFFIQEYVTCEGRYSFVYLYHIQLLLHLKEGDLINFPYFLWKGLSKMATAIRRRPKNENNRQYHHGLIKLFVSKELQKHVITWEQLLVEKCF